MYNFFSKMGRKTFLSLLILCGFISQGIGTLEDKSLDLHVRQKRVIIKTKDENVPVSIEQVPYIVNIHGNGSSICGGSILSPNKILSAASCFVDMHLTYTIKSASNTRAEGVSHNLIRKIVHHQWDFRARAFDIVILLIYPPIDLIGGPNRRISMYEKPVPLHTYGTFSGWGCNSILWGKRFSPKHLRSTHLRIISQAECQHQYARNRTRILNTHICTLDRSGHKGSCPGDYGGPLVLSGQQIGVLTYNKSPGSPESPDVFVNVADPDIRTWIHRNTILV